MLSPENRSLVIVVAGVLGIAFAFVVSNVAANHQPKPHRLPVGIVGSPEVADPVAGQLELSAPGAFEVISYSSPEVARTAILHRKVYGAFVPDPAPTLLVASAASRPAEQVLRQTFEAVARAQGQTLVVHDVAPLPPSDSGGATSFSAILSLTIAGILGSALIFTVAGKRPVYVRLAAIIALGIGAGLAAALATNVVVDAFHDNFLGVWGVATLFVLAIALPISAFQTVFGLPGTAFGLIAFIVVGTPASGGGSAPELLPGFWRAVSQLLPPGAAITSMRDVVYFDGHGATGTLVVMGTWAALGAIGAIVLYRLRGRAGTTTAS